MRAEEMWRWRIPGQHGNWAVTPHHTTEEAIRAEHPDAVRIEGTRIVMEVADTEQETRDSWFSGLDGPLQVETDPSDEAD
jgi:hypothetical protein